MPRCSQKTAKGLRCKSHGIETNGKIICATHLKHMDDSSMPDLVPVSSVPTPTPTPITTKEFDSVLSEMMSIIFPDYEARYYLSTLRSTHKSLIEGIYKKVPTAEKDLYWKYGVDDALDHILSTRLAGMPEDVTTWTGKDAQLNTLMNKLTEIHKAMLTQLQKPTQPQPQAKINPDRPETLEAAYERIDELQKKIAVAKEKSKEAAEGSLWKSGCEDMCYHLGNCSDVMGDCWVPVYHESGLDGLKNHLREVSKENHHGKACEECSETINRLHD